MATYAKVGEGTTLERVSNEMDKHLNRLRDINGEINENFEKILREVEARRDELLEQVGNMIIQFETKKKSVDDHLKELDGMIDHLEKEKVQL